MSSYIEMMLQVELIWALACCTPGANVLLTMNTALRYNRPSGGTAPTEPEVMVSGTFIRLAFFTSIVNPKTGLFVISLFSVAMPRAPSWQLTFLCVSLMGSITLSCICFWPSLFPQIPPGSSTRNQSN